jgi:hypothetical protein
MAQKYKSLLLNFLDFLNKKKITFRLEQQRDECILVLFTLVGMRIEVEVFDDDLEFCVFKGSEMVSTDQAALYKLINDNWD